MNSPRLSPDKPSPVTPVRHMLDVISNWYRRAIIHAINTGETPIPIAAITDQVLQWDRMHRELNISDDERERYIYAHIVSLNEFGVLVYHPSTETLGLADDVSISVAPPDQATEIDDGTSVA